MTIRWTDSEATEAARLLGVYTGNIFDIWILAGPSKASCRAHVMSALMGCKMPQSKSGINAIRDEFYRRLGVEGNCIGQREQNFIAACRRQFGQPEHNYGGSILR